MDSESTLSKVRSSLIPAAVAFIITFSLNFLTSALILEKGVFAIGPSVQVLNSHFVPVDFTNYSDEPLNDVQLSVPASTLLTKTITTSPVLLSQDPNLLSSPDRTLLRVSNIEPNRMTRLLIPISDPTEAASVDIINSQALRLVSQQVEDARLPIVARAQNALAFSLVYAAITFIGYFFIGTYFERKLKKSVDESQTLYEQAKKSSEHLMEEVEILAKRVADAEEYTNRVEMEATEARKTSARLRLILVARLSDYTKELRFWRDTIRKILYQNDGDTQKAEDVINLVTIQLETYSTLSTSISDFDQTVAMAAILSDGEREKDID